MDSESQNSSNPIENTTTPDSTTTTTADKPQPTEASDSSTDQSNIVDLIGNGQLVKKVFQNLTSMRLEPIRISTVASPIGIDSRTR